MSEERIEQLAVNIFKLAIKRSGWYFPIEFSWKDVPFTIDVMSQINPGLIFPRPSDMRKLTSEDMDAIIRLYEMLRPFHLKFFWIQHDRVDYNGVGLEPEQMTKFINELVEMTHNPLYELMSDGTKAQIQAAIDEVTKERTRIEGMEARRVAKLEREQRKAPGFIYLIQSASGHYKIGKTKNPDSRMKTFSVKLPFEVEYLALICTEDMKSLETQLHAKYADKRVNGEWFSLLPDDVAYIQSLAGGV